MHEGVQSRQNIACAEDTILEGEELVRTKGLGGPILQEASGHSSCKATGQRPRAPVPMPTASICRAARTLNPKPLNPNPKTLNP